MGLILNFKIPGVSRESCRLSEHQSQTKWEQMLSVMTSLHSTLPRRPHSSNLLIFTLSFFPVIATWSFWESVLVCVCVCIKCMCVCDIGAPLRRSPRVNVPVHGIDLGQVTFERLPELQLDAAHRSNAPCRWGHGAVVDPLAGRLVVARGIACCRNSMNNS